MTARSRIVAIGGNTEGASSPEDTASAVTETAAEPAEDLDWLEETPTATVGNDWTLPALAMAAILGWSGFFAWANPDILTGTTPQRAISLVTSWAVPVLLVGVVWLLTMRSSRREALRFGDAARLLSLESARLEERLTLVNRELSLAREFLTSQSQDLETLGRTASEKLSQHAEHLQSLVQTNGEQVEAIATVSRTALDNMESLRGHLPVIASSAKDVANNIGNAGRTAHAHLKDMIDGFNRLNEFGRASEGHVETLREQIDQIIEFLGVRLEELRERTETRFTELEGKAGEFHDRLEANEDSAMAALRARSTALLEELRSTRELQDSNEAESIKALHGRLDHLRQEGTTLSQSLREGEDGAMEALTQSLGRLETSVRETLMKLESLDQQAIDSARKRIAVLADEAETFEVRLGERNRAFAEDTAQRVQASEAEHAAQLERIGSLIAEVDHKLADRAATHEDIAGRIAKQGDEIVARIEEAGKRMAAIAAQASQTEESLGSSLQGLTANLADSHQAMSGATSAISHLTDDSVRLLELLQASSQQGREHLPEALAASVARLEDLETRVGELRSGMADATSGSSELSLNIAGALITLKQSLGEMNGMQGNLEQGATRYAALLASLKGTLDRMDEDSRRITETTRDELAAALDKLTQAARTAVSSIEETSTQLVSTLAVKLGEEATAQVEQVLGSRTEEAAGVLEAAASRAAQVSRDSAIQLRDQLSKIAELTGNLEKRVTHARERAEEQVDNEFSRRVALITESLNSNAIDIAKSLSSEVTDTAWASYLRGDRGVFTRRAVRLLDTQEARSIAQIYGDDPEFRDHVSRFIHDFEAMLRQVLSTRDGHALGVTLLSSDMGKLYVALAQAIERLRN